MVFCFPDILSSTGVVMFLDWELRCSQEKKDSRNYPPSDMGNQTELRELERESYLSALLMFKQREGEVRWWRAGVIFPIKVQREYEINQVVLCTSWHPIGPKTG